MEALRNASSEPDRLLQFLRRNLSRNYGGMDNLRLYKHTWIGTKYLIDDYIRAVCEAIEKLLEMTAASETSSVDAKSYHLVLKETLHYYGRSALVLSGGGTIGMKHIGVVKALFEADLLPKIISGTSAGSIVAAIAAQATDEEMPDIFEHFPFSNLAVFDPPGNGIDYWIYQRLRNFVLHGEFFHISHLRAVMKEWLGDITFREIYLKTGRVLNITVSGGDRSEALILNHVSAPDVLVWSAVCASCSVPLVFKPQNIYEKQEGTNKPVTWSRGSRALFADGSLDHDIPLRRLSEMFNVNFFVVSQVNPHVRLFLLQEEVFLGHQAAYQPAHSYIQGALQMVRDQIIHGAQYAMDMSIPTLFHRWVSLVNQQYTGNLNIMPEISLGDIGSLMANPTTEFMLKAVTVGERAVWPKMSRLKNSVQIELALRRGMLDLLDLEHFNPQARAARREARESSRRRMRGMARFRRERSLSNPRTKEMKNIVKTSEPPSPVPLQALRRTQSSASLGAGFSLTPMQTRRPPPSPSAVSGTANPFELSFAASTSA